MSDDNRIGTTAQKPIHIDFGFENRMMHQERELLKQAMTDAVNELYGDQFPAETKFVFNGQIDAIAHNWRDDSSNFRLTGPDGQTYEVEKIDVQYAMSQIPAKSEPEIPSIDAFVDKEGEFINGRGPLPIRPHSETPAHALPVPNPQPATYYSIEEAVKKALEGNPLKDCSGLTESTSEPSSCGVENAKRSTSQEVTR